MAMAVAAVPACGSDSSGDHPQGDPVVEPSQLDVGNYPTKPRQLELPKNIFVARAAEAQRLANILPLPFEIDPNLKFGSESQVHVFLETEGEAKTHLGPMFRWVNEHNFTEATNNYVAGFSATGLSDSAMNLSYELVNTTLIYSDETSARAAAEKLSQTEFYAASDNIVEGATLAAYPDSIARWQPSSQTLVSWLARDKYVLVTIVSHHENKELKQSDLPFLETLAQKSMDTTLPSLQRFRPTPPDKLMSVPIDPDNMRNRSLPRLEGDSFVNLPGTYDLHGSLNFFKEPKEAEALFTEAGVDRIAFDGGELIRARDSTAAAKLAEHRERPDRYSHTVDSPRGLPSAKCLEYRGPQISASRFICQMPYDRYVATTWAQQLHDAQQRISAHYLILANSK
ncbi:DUF7373 family lipoprotein [Nocardia wallacei]|uniref:DUF7373 family lipoprotein n=1 Tax=Nocardia wallacei TaxID=480035 RepID=UPI002453A7D2|nr:hypothetical protein [Nocardia wallacei]